ncbi:MAG: MarR family winged helix-turn-helix transcriptional regulator [Candidatus Aminicenantales bacterium]|jgi:DNA-binding MarR family transcriptional regulator
MPKAGPKAPRAVDGYVGIALIRAHRAFRQSGEWKLARLGLRLGQDLILFQLAAQEALSQIGLAERLGVEQATISIMLRRMEKAGFVRRRTDRADARVTRVSATRKGLSLVAPVHRLWREQERNLLNGLTDEDQRTLGKLLTRVRANLESRRTAHDGRAKNVYGDEG